MTPSYEPYGWTPDSTFINVDLPAPFSPQIAWISPRRTSRLTSCSALTPGNVLVIPLICRIASSVILLPSSHAEGRAAPEAPPARDALLQLRGGVVTGVDEV